MANRFLQPCRAVDIDAAAGGFAVFANDPAAADRAFPRHPKCPSMSPLHLDADDFGNHIAAAFDHHGVADLQTEARDLVFVVERGARDRNAADHLRRKDGHRCKGAGAAHLHCDALNLGLHLARRIFEGDGPARGFGREAKAALLRDAVHFQHDAIDFISERFALRFPLSAECEGFIDIGAALPFGVDFETVMHEPFEGIPMAVENRLAGFAQQEIGVVVEAARRCDGGLKNTQRTSGRVPGIGEASQVVLFAFEIEPLEGLAVHHHLAADFERLPVLHGKWQRADGAGVFSDLFSDNAVTAGNGLAERAVAETRGHRQPVHLQLCGITVGSPAQQFFDACVERAQLSLVERVVETEHGRTVRGFLKAFARLPANSLSRRIGREQLGMFALETLKLANELVILRVCDLGIIEDVILPFVMPNDFPKRFGLLFRRFAGGGLCGHFAIIVFLRLALKLSLTNPSRSALSTIPSPGD